MVICCCFRPQLLARLGCEGIVVSAMMHAAIVYNGRWRLHALAPQAPLLAEYWAGWEVPRACEIIRLLPREIDLSRLQVCVLRRDFTDVSNCSCRVNACICGKRGRDCLRSQRFLALLLLSVFSRLRGDTRAYLSTKTTTDERLTKNACPPKPVFTGGMLANINISTTFARRATTQVRRWFLVCTCLLHYTLVPSRQTVFA